MDEQARLTDLVPTRLGVLLLLLAIGLMVVAGLEALYVWMPGLADMTTDGRVAAFDLDGEGSLAVWFSSMTLAMAGLTAIVVFSVRRHRRDDYYGRYRVWLWAALCWFLLSLDETASLHEGFKEMMAHVTGTRLYGDGSVWWVTAYFFLLASVGTRLLMDMRECWLSTAAMVTTAVCYLLAVVTQLGWLLPESGARGVMLEEGAEMVGNLFLLLAMGLHARHVILDAEGRLPERRSRPLERRRDAVARSNPADEDQDGWAEDELEQHSRALLGTSQVQVHPPHGLARPAAARPATAAARPESAAAAKPSQTAAGSSDSGTTAHRKLTKAEKKAMRKKLRQLARGRERQGD